MSIHQKILFNLAVINLGILSTSFSASAGPYLDSGHADTTYGVCQTDICSTKGGDYSIGNCANCHPQHASIAGTSSTAHDFVLYAENFDTTAHDYTAEDFDYVESDNICFSCHNESGSVMQVTNYTYAQTFGGFTPDTSISSIIAAFNTDLKEGHTEHNLYDIWAYASGNSPSGSGTKFSYFTDESNPCVACHNPHLAKRNKTDPDNPSLTAISRPSDHENLWGDDSNETMKYYATTNPGDGVYQAPYFYSSNSTYEPDGTATSDGSLTPDYNSLCLDCHGNDDVYSSFYGRNLQQIDWSSTGDIHGGSPRYEGDYVSGAGLRPPYNDDNSGTNPNYVLACVDCHEPHATVLYNYGGYPSYLFRREVNGEELGCYGCGWTLNDADYTAMDLCLRCHTVGKHCGSQWECVTCHMHGHTASGGCGPDWNKKVF